MYHQILTLTLDGITAGDYDVWVRDPEPPALGSALERVAVCATPLGDSLVADLSWTIPPPDPATASELAGMPLTPDVTAVETRSAGSRARLLAAAA